MSHNDYTAKLQDNQLVTLGSFSNDDGKYLRTGDYFAIILSCLHFTMLARNPTNQLVCSPLNQIQQIKNLRSYAHVVIKTISNGNRTEWSPIRSVIIRVITKSDDRAAGVRFVYHEYHYRPNWTTRSPITN